MLSSSDLVENGFSGEAFPVDIVLVEALTLVSKASFAQTLEAWVHDGDGSEARRRASSDRS